MTTVEVQVPNRLGLHARAAARFVHCAARFRASVQVGAGTTRVNGKSILGLLTLAVPQGGRITIWAEGEDEAEAVEALADLVASGFEESP